MTGVKGCTHNENGFAQKAESLPPRTTEVVNTWVAWPVATSSPARRCMASGTRMRDNTLMPVQPSLRFISLFVPSLGDAVPRYRALLGVEPSETTGAAPPRHPFAAKGPVVFQLGAVALALYECDGKTTHPGDVGFGLYASVEQAVSCLGAHQGRVFWGPKPVQPEGRHMAVGMLPDRHFFEIVEADPPYSDKTRSP